ncbi:MULTISPECIES: hypothetical protein [Aliivibrio]|uniref:Apea-like HEPN domain-containing protein n=1 Tax=Aliivibrio finisterrensis TaxID=511998 RepID=A0A4V1Z7Z3_9GAMM|nr:MULTISPECIES: hypothetical protein [Aliivibrio]MDD9180678.1 hypothetical protein [Aliivibrio sp. A6]RYU47103.1 hypothetical protein ERW57_18765 [Aliivibrio finisterrensis]RYU47863.1 hypothetical protein ERW56_18930 [Aliivibrio finisterrensis]RYU53287.1 hypothetical protein ERW50_18650 [Aliivibrio finisterrensis]RYU59880.1 hypothetical protein ERW53_19705 [Aliivibrio finisterrensis]
MKVELCEIRVGKDKAEKYVLQIWKELDLPKVQRKFLYNEVKISQGKDDALHIDLKKEIDSVRKNGKANILQQMLDQKDRFLSTPVSISIMGDESGIKFNLQSQYADYSKNVSFPGGIEAPEVSFANDITHYRKEAYNAILSDDFGNLTRAYRSYLQCAVSLVDCFLHKYTFHLNGLVAEPSEYSNIATLNSQAPLEDRLEAWVTTFAAHKMTEFKSSKYRSKFIELKAKRNEMVHPTQPMYCYNVKEMVKFLNYAPEAIGGLLGQLRGFAQTTDKIGFIQQMKTEPPINLKKRA